MNSDQKRARWSATFAVLSCVLYFVAVIGGDAAARERLSTVAEGAALGESLRNIGSEPAAYLLMALPFVAQHSMAVYITRRSSWIWGCSAFLLMSLAFIAFFFVAHAEYYQLLGDRNWTAASLARPMAIGYSFGAIIVVAIAAEIFLRTGKRA